MNLNGNLTRFCWRSGEMVDTLDLSPSEPQGSYRFDSVLRYHMPY